MKKWITLLATLVCVLGLSGCTAQKEYGIRIVVPAGNQGKFIYSEEEILSHNSRLEIKSIDMPEEAKFVLKQIEDTIENTYEYTNFPKGEPMLIDVEKGAWSKIGVAIDNPSDEDIIIVFHVVDAKVRSEG